MSLESGAGRVFHITGKVASLFAADPKVVDVKVASANSIFIYGVAAGRSTVAALDDAGNAIAQFDVVVHPSSFGAGEAASQVHQDVPGANLQFTGTPNGIAVTGKTSDPISAERAAAVASDYLTDKQSLDDHSTINTSVQVTLRVRIAEISRTITRQFGINWTALANFGRWGVAGGVTDTLSQSSNLPSQVGLSFNDAKSSINTVLDLLAQDQLITMLAEPNLTARSGEAASFLAGGEFPVPVSGSQGQISVSFKQYGVSLAFVPTVLTSGRISLHVHPEVSELTTVGSVSVPIAVSTSGTTSSVTIPAITVRRADTTVELGSGQSFAVAGLLTANSTQNARGLPGIGETPVIGALFKSDLFQRDQSELVIVVTPYIVRPVNSPGQIHLPTDNFEPAGDVDRVLLNRQQARSASARTVVAPSAAALKPASATSSDMPAGAGFILH